ncbi:YybH family protein [Terriglobus saanensis]|uniref:DUF4440 domain-containing protein n=1 Tax=Terriglobus saanensis (strain ATCC BAA-1853 / DSM 23119 / SP1PR4) TaxID=401053 RepID=E8UZG0_TERSS|nr:SgcJ/EcaC family oxidoreductase [Terriglobus saanensis]ADV83240.1 hypothetical protein AciPR4_2460 [Terriglobus saanensis SP1PR4]
MKSFREFFDGPAAIARGVIVCSCLAIPLATIGCHQATPSDTRASDEQKLRALDGQWSRTAGTHDVDAAVAFYADDAMLLPPDEPIVASKAAIRASWTATFDVFAKLSWEIKTIEVAKSGDLAYTTGAWTGALKGPNGSQIPVSGKLVSIWKKQADGQWKCIVDTYNSDAPSTPPPVSNK